MELTQREFDQIGSYVREHLGTWIRDVSPPATIVQLDPVYLERIVRVEEELKSQRELMKQGFEAMEKRFEAVDKRFEQVDKRFEQVDKRFEAVDKRFEGLREDSNIRFEQMRVDMKDGFAVSRSHTNHWMTYLTIVLLAFGVAMTLVPVLVG